MILFAPHAPEPAYLRAIIEKMRKLGPPRLYAYWRKKEKAWYALEGSHRTAAAKHLGIVPIIKQVYLSSEIDHDTKDVHPDRRVRSVLKFYDRYKCWMHYEF